MPTSTVNRKEGELLKYKNVFTGWGKRYFRLERSYLHYFQTKHTHEPIATVTRGEIAEVKPSAAFPGKENVFEIVHKSGLIWYCQAKSAEEMVGWMQSLSTVPVLLDPAKYPTIASEYQPQPAVNPHLHDENQPPTHSHHQSPLPPPLSHPTDSPYRALIDEAHQTAYTCDTPHNCQHLHHHHSPPPPYSAEGTRPPFDPPTNYEVKPPGYQP